MPIQAIDARIQTQEGSPTRPTLIHNLDLQAQDSFQNPSHQHILRLSCFLSSFTLDLYHENS